MKSLFMRFATAMIDVLFSRLLRKFKKSERVYTWRKAPESPEYHVGYWSNQGDFIQRATVESEEDAESLAAQLNQASF